MQIWQGQTNLPGSGCELSGLDSREFASSQTLGLYVELGVSLRCLTEAESFGASCGDAASIQYGCFTPAGVLQLQQLVPSRVGKAL